MVYGRVRANLLGLKAVADDSPSYIYFVKARDGQTMHRTVESLQEQQAQRTEAGARARARPNGKAREEATAGDEELNWDP